MVHRQVHKTIKFFVARLMLMEQSLLLVAQIHLQG